MPDREQVKYDIERCISHVPDACRDCSHYWGEKDGDVTAIDCMEELLTEAHTLLKEQEEHIKTLENQLETITKWRANAGAFD